MAHYVLETNVPGGGAYMPPSIAYRSSSIFDPETKFNVVRYYFDVFTYL